MWSAEVRRGQKISEEFRQDGVEFRQGQGRSEEVRRGQGKIGRESQKISCKVRQGQLLPIGTGHVNTPKYFFIYLFL